MSEQGSDTLLARAGKGVAWAFSSMTGSRLIAFGSMLLLARLLAPDDFGVLAIPLLLITYLETVGDLGTGAALVRQQENADSAALVAFAFNALLGLAWAGLILASAGPVAEFFASPETGDVARLMSVVFVVKALGNTHDALLRRELHFGRRAVTEVLRAVVRAVVAIALALAGFGAWSLAWGHVAGTVAWTLSQWALTPWRPWRHLDATSRSQARQALPSMLGFGSQIVLVNALSAVLHHVDKLIVGRMGGVGTLGLYSQAYRIPETAISTLTWAVGRVGFPAFARTGEDRGAKRRLYLTALRFVSWTALPAAAGLFVLAEPVLVVAYGAAWAPAAPFLGWLSLTAAFRSVGSPAGDFLKGSGRADLLRNLALVKACVILPALAMAARTGSAEAVAIALASATLLTSGLNVMVAMRLVPVEARVIARELVPALVAAVAMGWLVHLAGSLTAGLSAGADVALRVPLGAGSYSVLLWLFSSELRLMLRRRRRGGES